MVRLVPLVPVVAFALAAVVAAQTTPPTPPPQQQQPPPIFRGRVDVIQLDVSVLDKDRRPVRDLTQADFTVLENGKPQKIVAVSAIDMIERDPVPTARMRYVPKDVSFNDLTERLGDGRVFAIVMDDVNVPYDTPDFIRTAKEIGRIIVENLGPSDLAAVVLAQDGGRSEDFTNDRHKLLEAVERYNARALPWVPQSNGTAGPGGGDMPQRFSPFVGPTTCQRLQPTVPALDTVTTRLAAIPNRRKTVIFISTGVPINLGGGRGCESDLADEMREVFRKAQRANVNIYSVDPGGFRGYESYLLDRAIRGRAANGAGAAVGAQRQARFVHDFIDVMAIETGARAVISTDNFETEIEHIFTEDAYYYLVGYQTANLNQDGKFRRLEVKVNRPGVTVRTRNGYWGARAGSSKAIQDEMQPPPTDLSFAGITGGSALPMRATAVPVALVSPGTAARTAAVAVAVSVREPNPIRPLTETLTIITNIYDADGRASPPLRQTVTKNLTPAVADDVRFELLLRTDLAPGRYQMRINVRSAVLDQSSSVFADIEVPDFVRKALSMSGIVLGTPPSPDAPRTDVLAALVPIVPTTAREFAPNDRPVAFVRFYQGAGLPPSDVTIHTEVLDVQNKSHLDVTETLAASAFDASNSAEYRLVLPIEKLGHGPYVLAISATRGLATSERRDLIFRVR